VIHCADPDNTGVDMYIGTGGAPEACCGGGTSLYRRQMQCRLILDSEESASAPTRWASRSEDDYGIEDMHAALPVCRDRRHHRLAAVGRQVRKD